MDTAGGWGKPLKKPKETATAPSKTATNTTAPPQTQTQTQTQPQTQAPAPVQTQSQPVNAAKITTKSETYVPPTVLEPIPVVARAKEGLYLVDDQIKDYLSDTSRVICEDSTISLFSSNGDILAFANPDKIGVFVFSEQNGESYDLPNVLALSFSPGLRFLVAIDKRESKHYINIFEPKTLKKLLEYETTRYKKETWPQLKFVGDDEIAFRALVPGRVEALDPKNKFQLIKTIEAKHFDFFDISKKRENLIIVCVVLEHTAGYEKNEGKIEIYDYDGSNTKPAVTRIIDKAHEVNLFFSPTGKHLLAWAQTFTDKTGQSYYGEHMLLYLDIEKKSLKRVPTYKGPIHDVAWNPDGNGFIAISGFMPANSVLYTSESIPKFEFGRHHRNTIKWNPHSRFVCLGGFGNLSGEMEIWDITTLQKLGNCKSNTAVSCLWSPDGRRILTGILNPRLRVDNGYKVFKYNGEQLNFIDFSQTELYEVIWKPGQYPDRPATPTKKVEKKEEEPQKAFRPKGSTFAAQLKAQKEPKATGGRFLDPDEIFGNEANIEVEKEEQPKKKKRIRKKKDKKAGEEEGKDDDDGEDEK